MTMAIASEHDTYMSTVRPGDPSRSRHGLVGAPSKYTPQLLERTRELVGKGFTDEELAEALGIAAGTLWEYKKKFPEFYEIIEAPKVKMNAKVEAAAFAQAAGGVIHEGTADEKRIDPVPSMTKWWLANRRPGRWKERQVHGDVSMQVGLDEEARDAINVLGIVAKAQAAGQVVEGELVEDQAALVEPAEPVQAEPLRPPQPAVKAPARPKQPGAARVAPPPKPRAR